MQNNVTDLSQKLQRSLDNNYNVVDMPAVIEIISTLEKTAVTKELLETTRLGKSINELRRRTSNESLAKRAKDLLKKWRDLILPNANGQVKQSANSSNNLVSSSCTVGDRSTSPDTGQQLLKSRKRPARTPDHPPPKRPVSSLNGQSRDLDFSDNSNCSIKDFSTTRKTDVIFINSDSNSSLPDHHSIDSHSNDTLDIVDSSTTAPPKKRGRKKGSKNHKNLIIAAEESFTNKMSAVSRNSKVKTTQELLADLQNRTVVAKQDIELRAAQLTESLSRIDQKLNPQKQINKNVVPMRNDRGTGGATTPVTRAGLSSSGGGGVGGGITTTHSSKTSNIEQHWSHRSTPEVVVLQSDDEIVDVVGTDPPHPALVKDESSTTAVASDVLLRPVPTSGSSEPLTISGLLAKLPPLDMSFVEEPDEVPLCACPLPPVQELPPSDKITVQIVDGDSKPADSSIFGPPSPDASAAGGGGGVTIDAPPSPAAAALPPPVVDEETVMSCAARSFLRHRYNLDAMSHENVLALHSRCLPGLNGNVGLCPGDSASADGPPAPGETLPGGLFVNIVPNLTMERLRKDLSLRKSCAASENYKKYSISNNSCTDGGGSGDTEPSIVGDRSVEVGEYGDVLCRTATTTIAPLVNRTDTKRDVMCDVDADKMMTGDFYNNTTTTTTTTTVVDDHDNDDDGGIGEGHQFREWHETLDVVSYNGETLRILPYVIID